MEDINLLAKGSIKLYAILKICSIYLNVFSLNFLKIDFNSRAVLGSQHNGTESRESSHTPSVPHKHIFFTVNILHQGDAFLSINTPMLTCQPKVHGLH